MTRPVRLGVDAANLLVDRRGIGRYARSLLVRFAGMRDRLELVLLVPHLFTGSAHRQLAESLGMASFSVARRARAGKLGLDLIWFPWNGMTWAPSVRAVATVHDVWPFVSPAVNPRIRPNEQRPFRETAARAARIIADSAFTKSEIVRHLGVPENRIDVVPLGVFPAREVLSAAAALPDGVSRYVLFVGEAEPRKDLGTLVNAMSHLPEPLRHDTALVVAGRRAHWRNFPHDLPDRTYLLGQIGDDRLAALYRGAAAFVFPSTYEGFGLPVLEAMAHGAPVVASDAASIPEAGGDAALYFKAGDPASLADRLAQVLGDESLARRLREAGMARAAQMTWDRCARATLAVFEKVVL